MTISKDVWKTLAVFLFGFALTFAVGRSMVFVNESRYLAGNDRLKTAIQKRADRFRTYQLPVGGSVYTYTVAVTTCSVLRGRGGPGQRRHRRRWVAITTVAD